DHAAVVLLYFFFQAEDGIRDFHVTGVQTCALPISLHRLGVIEQERQVEQLQLGRVAIELRQRRRQQLDPAIQQGLHLVGVAVQRSEERRVGKECRSRTAAAQ